jgi:hypothetical protein
MHQEEEATGSPGEPTKSLVDLEASTWNHAVCSLEPTNLVKKKQDSEMTSVKSIAGIGIGDINQKKLGVCWALVSVFSNPSRGGADRRIGHLVCCIL